MVVALLACALWPIFAIFPGCATTQGTVTQITNSVGQVTSTTIPRLQQVKAGLWRSGQPHTPQEWAFLKTVLGITNVVKLNEGSEFSDQGALDAGMTLHYFPIDVMEQMKPPGPSDMKMQQILAAMRQPGTLVHCTEGRDRTSLAAAIKRLEDGWSKDAAWAEMKANGYHEFLFGLTACWKRQ